MPKAKVSTEKLEPNPDPQEVGGKPVKPGPPPPTTETIPEERVEEDQAGVALEIIGYGVVLAKQLDMPIDEFFQTCQDIVEAMKEHCIIDHS